MPKWTDKDTAKHSGDSLGQVARAEHQAREDASKSGDFSRGDSEKNSQPFSSKNDSATKEASGFWKSIFKK